MATRQPGLYPNFFLSGPRGERISSEEYWSFRPGHFGPVISARSFRPVISAGRSDFFEPKRLVISAQEINLFLKIVTISANTFTISANITTISTNITTATIFIWRRIEDVFPNASMFDCALSWTQVVFRHKSNTCS